MNPLSREALTDLLQTFRIKPRLRRELRYIPEEITDWEDRDFLAIYTRSKTEGVIVAPLEQMFVVSFRLTHRTPNSHGRIEAIICDFCSTWQRGTASAVLTLVKTDRTVSFLVCGDLNCSLHIRDKTPAAKLSRTQLRENNTEEERIARLKVRLQACLTDKSP